MTRSGLGPSAGDIAAVTEMLGRAPRAKFVVVIRRGDGQPVVIANEPLLDDGTPMPTRYWLVDDQLRSAVGRLEARGGVALAEAAIQADAIADAHRRYAAERDALIPKDYRGPVPSGGVGGTARGVKCLHAHLAWWLAGGDDPIGAWTATALDIDRNRSSS